MVDFGEAVSEGGVELANVLGAKYVLAADDPAAAVGGEVGEVDTALVLEDHAVAGGEDVPLREVLDLLAGGESFKEVIGLADAFGLLRVEPVTGYFYVLRAYCPLGLELQQELFLTA